MKVVNSYVTESGKGLRGIDTIRLSIAFAKQPITNELTSDEEGKLNQRFFVNLNKIV